MKKYIHKKTIILTLAIIAIAGCTKFVDGIDDFKIGVTSEIFEQNAVIQLKDYFGDYQNIIDTDLKVEFSGADADKLVNEAGDLVISETDGFIQLNVNPNKSTGVKELKFNVTISGGSYRTETFPVILKDTTSLIQLALVDESKIYKGTNTVTKTVGLTNNASTSTVTIKTDKTTSLNKTAVTINTGTQFKDATGNTLTGADIKVEIINTDGAGQTVQDTKNLTFRDINGAAITGKTAQFIAGNTSIKMNINGTAVKTFNTPIAVNIEISSSATHPTTGKTVKIGDDFPVYTSQENSTAWTYHGLGKVVTGDTTDTFNITFETTHLSKYGIVNFEDIVCEISDRTYNLTATNLPSNFSGFLEVEWWQTIFTSSGFSPAKTANIFSVWVENGKIARSTAGRNSIHHNQKFYSKDYNWNKINDFISSGRDKLFHAVLLAGLIDQLVVKMNGVKVRDNISAIAVIANCELAINFSRDLIPNIDSLKNINIDLAVNCSGNVFIPDGFPIYVKRPDGSFSYEGTIKKGKVTLNSLELNKKYTFKTMYDGKSKTHEWTFTSTTFKDLDYKLPGDVCDAIGL